MGKILICTIPGSTQTAFADKDAEIRLSLGDSVDLPLSNNRKNTDIYYKLGLKKIEYDKGVFSHSVINLHFSVVTSGNPTVSLLKEALLDQEMMVDVYDDIDSETNNRKCIAQNHFVHGIDFSRNGTELECVLKCFSYDRKIAGSRACSVFSGVQFGENVFSGELKKSVLADYYSFKTSSLMMMGYHKDKMLRDGTHDAELIHPYLVRYDESLYDFLSRIAHRCGEFLYFDGGMLHLGLPDDTVAAIVKNDFHPLKTNGKDEPLLNYNEIGGDEDDDTSEFSTDYLMGKLENSSGGTTFDMQYSSDDYLRLVSSDDRVKSSIGWWILNKALGTFFTCSDALAGGVTAAWNGVVDLITAGAINPAAAEGSFNDNYVNKDNQYATSIPSNTMSNLSNAYYHSIEKLEVKAERGMLTVCYSDYLPPYGIGSAFSVNDGMDGRYVITRMYGSFSCDSSNEMVEHSNYVEAVPVFPSSVDSLPVAVVPPRGTVHHFRKVRPMEAIVIRNDDPLRLGRIKIRYPWQYDDEKTHAVPSPWIRIAVPFAGGKDTSGGFTMIPDVGEHVMVKYLADNMERPYVDGSLYFKTHKPLTLPDAKPHVLTGERRGFVISSPKGHKLLINDSNDSNALEQVLPIIKPIIQIFEACGCSGGDEYLGQILGGGVTLMDGSAMCMLNLSPDKRSIAITSNYGRVDISAFTGMTISAPNGDIRIRGKNVSIEAGNNLTLNSGGNIKSEKTDYASMLGTIFGEVLSGALNGILKSYTGVDLEGCLDLTFLRCLFEIVMRPVEGTLSLKSNRNVVMTAGRGMVNVPATMLSKEKTKDGLKGPWKTYDRLEPDSPLKIHDSLESIMAAVDTFYEAEKNARATIISLDKNLTKRGVDWSTQWPGAIVEGFKNFIDDAADNNTDDGKEPKVEGDMFNGGTSDTDPNVEKMKKSAYQEYLKLYGELRKRATDYKKKYWEMEYLKILLRDHSRDKVTVGKFPDDYKEHIYSQTTALDALKYSNVEKIKNFKKVQKRSALLQYLTACGCEFILNDSEDALATLDDLNDARNNNSLLKRTNDLTSDPLKSLITNTDVPAASVAPAAPAVAPPAVAPPDFCTQITTSLKPAKEDQTQESKATVKSVCSNLGSSVLRSLGGGATFDVRTQQWIPAPQIRSLVNYKGKGGPRAVFSEISTNGNIMLSSHPSQTFHLKSDSSGWFTTRNVLNTALLKGLIQSFVDLN